MLARIVFCLFACPIAGWLAGWLAGDSQTPLFLRSRAQLSNLALLRDDFDVIVVDDASQDDSVAQLRRLGLLVVPANPGAPTVPLGQASTRNIMVRASRDKGFAFFCVC